MASSTRRLREGWCICRRRRIASPSSRAVKQAGVGTPDGTDVTGRIEPLATGRILLERVFHSLRPAALAHGVSTEACSAAALAALDRDASRFAGHQMLWPLLIGAWKQKEQA